MKRTLTALAMLAVAAAPAFADQPVDVTRAASPNAAVHIDNIAGSVKIIGWDKNSVHVTGHIDDDQHLEVTGDKNNITVHVEYRDNDDNDERAVLVVHLPQASSVEASTVSAPLDVRQVAGSQHLKSVSGDITLESKAPEIDVQSVSGNVKVKGSAQNAHVEIGSVSGDVHVSGIKGELRGQSVSGSVSADMSRFQRAEMGSTSGDLAYNAALEKGGVYKFHSTSGDIVLNLPAKPDAEFDINTFSGDIRNDFGPKSKRTGRYTPGSELHFTSGNGSAHVRVETLSGGVVLRIGD